MTLLTLLLCTPLIAMAAQSSPMPPPRIVQTHSNIFGGVILWDATPYIERYIAEKWSPKDGMAALEVQGLKIFIEHASTVAKTERHLRLVASFTKSGAISARYQTSTLEGIQTIFTLDGNLQQKMQFSRNWEAEAQRGLFPKGVRLQVVSEIPTN